MKMKIRVAYTSTLYYTKAKCVCETDDCVCKTDEKLEVVYD